MVDVEETGNKLQSQMRLHAEPEDDAADLPLPALFDRASRLHALASSSALDQVPPSSLFWELGSSRPSSAHPEIEIGWAVLTRLVFFSAAQDGIRTGVDLLRRCDDMVSKLGLFSPNETKEDVSTANLKYLLVCPSPSPFNLLCSPY
jgi:immunoglobulin-binding protein 1